MVSRTPHDAMLLVYLHEEVRLNFSRLALTQSAQFNPVN
jgi:hypothetical protein